MKRFLVFALALTGLTIGAAREAKAEPIYALVGDRLNARLLGFDSTNPGAITSSVNITGTGLALIVGIDFRPSLGSQNGVLYGFAFNQGFGQIYTIDPLTGVATQGPLLINAGTGGAVLPNGFEFGVDFDPVSDRLRVVSNFFQHLRIDVDNGVTDVELRPSEPASTVGLAHTNNFAGATTTQLFAINSFFDNVLVESPSSGMLTAVGPLGINTRSEVGFDISGLTDTAYASLTPGFSFGSPSSLFTTNLTTGQASLIGQIGTGFTVIDIAAPVGRAAVPEPATMLLFGTGLAGIAAKLCRRRKAYNQD